MRGGLYAYSNGTLYAQSNFGYYWSRRLAGAPLGYYLGFGSGYVNLQNSNGRGDGFALRCLAREKVIKKGTLCGR